VHLERDISTGLNASALGELEGNSKLLLLVVDLSPDGFAVAESEAFSHHTWPAGHIEYPPLALGSCRQLTQLPNYYPTETRA